MLPDNHNGSFLIRESETQRGKKNKQKKQFCLFINTFASTKCDEGHRAKLLSFVMSQRALSVTTHPARRSLCPLRAFYRTLCREVADPLESDDEMKREI